MESPFRREGAGRVSQSFKLRLTALAATVLGLAAVGPAWAQDAKTDARIPDPWEHLNRGFYKFSMSIDRAVIAPAIHAYRTAAPEPFRRGVKNVVYNLYEPRTAANDLLQGHVDRFGNASARFLVNSTVGLGGLIDVASKTGIPAHDSDFGQTLGRYGVGTGPYIFVPFAGPSDLRDGIGRLADGFGDPVGWAAGGLNTTFGQVRAGVSVVQARVDIDDQLRGLDRDFTDPYATLRSGYSQNRAYKVRDARGENAAAVNNLPDFGGDAGAPAAPAKP